VDNSHGILGKDPARFIGKVANDKGSVRTPLLLEVPQLLGCPLDECLIKNLPLLPWLLWGSLCLNGFHAAFLTLLT
jgi:hypothetical protein